MSLLNEIQQKLKVPKTQTNSFGKYNYRNAEDILEAIKPLLGAGVLILSDEVVEVAGRHYIKATAELTAPYDTNTKQVWAATGWAREALDKKGMDEAQITGAASSYARKYALNGLFCIDDTKDADSDEPKTEAPARATSRPKPAPKLSPSPEQSVVAAKDRIKTLLGLLDEPNGTVAQVTEAVKRLLHLELQPANFDKIGDELAALLKKRKSTTE